MTRLRDYITFWTVIFYALCGVAGFGIASAVVAVSDREPPITYIEARAVTKNVMAGQRLNVLFDVERTAICRLLTVNRYVAASDGREYAIAGYDVDTTTRPGRERYDRYIVIPSDIPPGPAEYWIRLQFGCNWYQVLFQPLRVESPRVRFNVIADPDAVFHQSPLP